MKTISTAASKSAPTAKIILRPPAWTLPAGAVAALLSVPYILLRLASGEPGLGLLPYAFVLLVGAVILLPECRDRIEADDDYVIRFRGNKSIARCATKEITEVRAGFLNKSLLFAKGRKLSIRDYWVNAERLTNFFQRRLQTRTHKAQRDLTADAVASRRAPGRAQSPGALRTGAGRTPSMRTSGRSAVAG